MENLAVFDNNNVSLEQDITNTNDIYTSINLDAPENKAKLFKAMNNPDERIADMINKEIKVTDIFCEMIECTNEDGNVTICPRVVLIDEKGKSYYAVSTGIYNSVKKLIAIFGVPTWNPAITIIPKQISKKDRKILTLDVKF